MVGDSGVLHLNEDADFANLSLVLNGAPLSDPNLSTQLIPRAHGDAQWTPAQLRLRTSGESFLLYSEGASCSEIGEVCLYRLEEGGASNEEKGPKSIEESFAIDLGSVGEDRGVPDAVFHCEFLERRLDELG
jgi:hypothetical protein